jgi:hypothetical protein
MIINMRITTRRLTSTTSTRDANDDDENQNHDD